MVLLGAGLGVVMPVMNLAVQNEFEQHELGAATSSSQLFRSLGSTIGVAVFGAVLTAGMTAGLTNIQQDKYVQMLEGTPVVSKIGDLDDTNTLLNLNMPQTKEKVTEGFTDGTANLQPEVREKVIDDFKQNQTTYAGKITQSFSDSLSRIFITSTILMAIATVLVFMLHEKPLAKARPEDAPGVV